MGREKTDSMEKEVADKAGEQRTTLMDKLKKAVGMNLTDKGSTIDTIKQNKDKANSPEYR